MADDLVSVRYLVDDVDAALAFYTTHLGFSELTHWGPAFADVVRGNLRLLLSGPASSAGRPPLLHTLISLPAGTARSGCRTSRRARSGRRPGR